MRNVNEWQLFHLAAALTRAKRLEKQRATFHRELYAAILYPTVHYDKEFTGNMGNPAVDIQAFRLAESKERYGRKIQREYERFLRWQDLLTWVDSHEKVLLVRYFEKKKPVRPEIISRLLHKIEKRLDQEERRIEQERLEQSIEDYEKYQQQTQAFRKVHIPVDDGQDRKQYLIDGQFVQLTVEEYQTYQHEQEATRGELEQIEALTLE